jgi:hypothetical protein
VFDCLPLLNGYRTIGQLMDLKNRTSGPVVFTRLDVRIRQEDGAFTVSVRLLNHHDQSQGAWGEEIAPSIEIASSMIGCLAEQFSIPQKCISIKIGMSNFKDGTLH